MTQPGKICGITGPTVSVDTPDLGLYDQVAVGPERLIGEVVRLEQDRALVQLYESTHDLVLRQKAEGMGTPLTAFLGPGLLGGIFDGLQRPLKQMSASDPFIRKGVAASILDNVQTWQFTPCKAPGDTVAAGEKIGSIPEDFLNHPVYSPWDGRINTISSGAYRLAEPVATLDDGREIFMIRRWPVRLALPYGKKIPPAEPLITGQRVIDFLFPLARGGTAIIPGGFGTGKTILQQAIAKFAEVDIVVYVGCGERGNEMAEMLAEFGSLVDPWTGSSLMQRTVMIANTSNMPVAAREASIYTAVTMAEYFRGLGLHILLLADSISRWAEALREISSALEELPGEEGYPSYLASRLTGFFAREGTVETLEGKTGSLSLIVSVSPPGGDFTEPATQACLRTSGAFFMLDTALAHRRHFPAINWFQSFSLYENTISKYFQRKVLPEWQQMRQECQSILQKAEKIRQVAEIVGTDGLQEADRLILDTEERIRSEFLYQNSYSDDAFSTPELTGERISRILLQHQESIRKMRHTPFEKGQEGPP